MKKSVAKENEKLLERVQDLAQQILGQNELIMKKSVAKENE